MFQDNIITTENDFLSKALISLVEDYSSFTKHITYCTKQKHISIHSVEYKCPMSLNLVIQALSYSFGSYLAVKALEYIVWKEMSRFFRGKYLPLCPGVQ